MHGILHKSLKNYVGENIDEDVWDDVLDRADIDPKLYLPVSHYPDEELVDAIAVLAEMSGHEVASVQRDFGTFVAPDLLSTFKAHVRDDWSTFDLLAALPSIYEQLEAQNPETNPPDVDVSRLGPDAVVVEYRSERDLCSLGEGIVVGASEALDDPCEVTQEMCVRDGEDHCEFHVERSD
jgi:predicted hydrocarbon binding protein